MAKRRKYTHELMGVTKSAPYRARCACGFRTNGRATEQLARTLFWEHIRDVIARELEGN